ncbi:MAG TPA: HAD family hydrolase [Vicinamibacterales bacterium]|nr:HAD family hydrolase [Vicinamibacterales bacterium]
MSGLRRAVFLDRDGTIIEEAGYPDRLDRILFYPFSVDAVRTLNAGGFVVVVVTNQSGIARGIVPEPFVGEAHEFISDRMRAGGARIDAFYYCRHHPGAIDPALRACDCRKPQPGLMRQAAADLGLDLSRSFVVGDRWKDLGAGQPDRIRGVLVRTGVGLDQEQDAAERVPGSIIVDDLAAAAAWILQQP